MAWILVNPEMHSIFASLGVLQGDTYQVSEHCLSYLKNILEKLLNEDRTLRTFRRAIGFGQNIKKDLLPLLIYCKNDNQIIDATIRILVNLTVPVECLLSTDAMLRTDVGRHTIFELNRLLATSKEAFSDARATKAILDYIKQITETQTSYSSATTTTTTTTAVTTSSAVAASTNKLSYDQCDSINNCLLLLRNVLHIPPDLIEFTTRSNGERNLERNETNGTNIQNQILWNLFTQSIDKVILHLVTHKQTFVHDGHVEFWGVTIVQLIALMYKDQHFGTLHKLLNLWVEASLSSESSEDNESNTSPPPHGGGNGGSSGDSSPILTSDPTSDSSDNGGSGNSGSGNSNTNGNTGNNNSNNDTTTTTTSTTTSTTTTTKTHQQLHNEHNEHKHKQQQLEQQQQQQQQQQQMNVDDGEKTNISNQFRPKGITACMKNISQRFKKPFEHGHQSASSSSGISSGTASTSAVGNKKASNNKMSTNNCSNNNNNNNNTSSSSTSGIGSNSIKKMELTSELSDCGYGTQMEKESISSSNDDDSYKQNQSNQKSTRTKPVHQKPPSQKLRFNNNIQRATITLDDKKELRRKKLVKRSKTHIINMKGLMQHIPTDEDISNILKEFTVDFLLKGYSLLVEDLYKQLLTDQLHLQIDTSHFFWLITYFLKFATQLELDLEHVQGVLSYDIISYLIYEGVDSWEKLEIASKQVGRDLKPFLRRMHLVVTAIREFLQTLDIYQKIQRLSTYDKQYLKDLQIQLAKTEQFKLLFVLLIRKYNPKIQNLQYLQDLIVTNHILIMFLDNINKYETKVINKQQFSLNSHIEKFATVEMMYQYGLLLEHFQNNGEYVNNCIFTMMHHVGGDLKSISTLFQPIILKTFSQIWETDYDICDDWSDLIEYVIHKFINTPRQTPASSSNAHFNSDWPFKMSSNLPSYIKPNIEHILLDEQIIKTLSMNDNKKEEDKEEKEDIMDDSYHKTESILESRHSKQLKQESQKRNDNTDNTSYIIYNTEFNDNLDSDDNKNITELNIYKELLLKEDNCDQYLLEIQKLLLDVCYCKLNIIYGFNTTNTTQNNKNINTNVTNINHCVEPIPYHYCVLKKAIPLVTWSTEECRIYEIHPFIMLMQKLGLLLPTDTGNIFIRIPITWTPDLLFQTALRLGPIDTSKLNFDIKYLKGFDLMNQEQTTDTKFKDDLITEQKPNQGNKNIIKHNTSSMFPFSTLPNPPTNWLQTVMRANNCGTIRTSISKPAMSIEIPSLNISNNIINTSSTNANMDLTSSSDRTLKISPSIQLLSIAESGDNNDDVDRSGETSREQSCENGLEESLSSTSESLSSTSTTLGGLLTTNINDNAFDDDDDVMTTTPHLFTPIITSSALSSKSSSTLLVMKTTAEHLQQPMEQCVLLDINEHTNIAHSDISETCSVASDLTRMCVSDEEDGIDVEDIVGNSPPALVKFVVNN
uniref:Protein timeless n=1 Tax=Chrysoperla nipponensis TaxID=413239 RepID=A0A9E9EL61_CHRNP|nr:protein timeless [Chrysoperla nipponensis]